MSHFLFPMTTFSKLHSSWNVQVDSAANPKLAIFVTTPAQNSAPAAIAVTAVPGEV